MSSVRHFYFFICINILFYISLQCDDENSDKNPESSTNTSESESKQCIKNLEGVEINFKSSFRKLQGIVNRNASQGFYGVVSTKEPYFTNFILGNVTLLVKNTLKKYEKPHNFCMVLWLRCYNNKSIEMLDIKEYSADSIKYARIKKDEGETSDVNRNLKKLKLNNMLHDLPMWGCKIEERTETHHFHFSLFEESFHAENDVHLHFFLFKGKINKNHVEDVKLYAYTLIDYISEEFQKWLNKKEELKLKNTNNSLY